MLWMLRALMDSASSSASRKLTLAAELMMTSTRLARLPGKASAVQAKAGFADLAGDAFNFFGKKLRQKIGLLGAELFEDGGGGNFAVKTLAGVVAAGGRRAPATAACRHLGTERINFSSTTLARKPVHTGDEHPLARQGSLQIEWAG
jgi:hypothetical protein